MAAIHANSLCATPTPPTMRRRTEVPLAWGSRAHRCTKSRPHSRSSHSLTHCITCPPLTDLRHSTVPSLSTCQRPGRRRARVDGQDMGSLGSFRSACCGDAPAASNGKKMKKKLVGGMRRAQVRSFRASRSSSPLRSPLGRIGYSRDVVRVLVPKTHVGVVFVTA